MKLGWKTRIKYTLADTLFYQFDTKLSLALPYIQTNEKKKRKNSALKEKWSTKNSDIHEQL